MVARASLLAITLAVILSAATVGADAPRHSVLADQQPITHVQGIQLYVGDSLIVQSDQNSIQRVFLQGNLTAANMTKPAKYPTSEFALTVFTPETCDVTVMFDLQADYHVNVYVQSPNRSRATNTTAYYISSGPSELDIRATFVPRSDNASLAMSSESPGGSFMDWVGRFGEAFPVWVKLLYLVLSIQFFAVGGVWIRRASTKRESGPQRLDAGDKAFLWLDVAYKYLVSSLVALVLLMGGELIVLFILRFMFLVTLNLLSLWDLFVVGFALGAVIIVYLIRLACEKILDMRPLEDE